MQVLLYSGDRDPKRAQWCSVHLQYTLTGEVDVVFRCGRMGHKNGHERVERFGCEGAAMSRMREILQRRYQEGYVSA